MTNPALLDANGRFKRRGKRGGKLSSHVMPQRDMQLSSHVMPQRDMQPSSHVMPQRDMQLSSHLIPQRDMQLSSHVMPQRDMQLSSHVIPQRDMQLSSHVMPQRDMQLSSHLIPQRDMQLSSHVMPQRDMQLSSHLIPQRDMQLSSHVMPQRDMQLSSHLIPQRDMQLSSHVMPQRDMQLSSHLMPQRRNRETLEQINLLQSNRQQQFPLPQRPSFPNLTAPRFLLPPRPPRQVPQSMPASNTTYINNYYGSADVYHVVPASTASNEHDTPIPTNAQIPKIIRSSPTDTHAPPTTQFGTRDILPMISRQDTVTNSLQQGDEETPQPADKMDDEHRRTAARDIFDSSPPPSNQEANFERIARRTRIPQPRTTQDTNTAFTNTRREQRDPQHTGPNRASNTPIDSPPSQITQRYQAMPPIIPQRARPYRSNTNETIKHPHVRYNPTATVGSDNMDHMDPSPSPPPRPAPIPQAKFTQGAKRTSDDSLSALSRHGLDERPKKKIKEVPTGTKAATQTPASTAGPSTATSTNAHMGRRVDNRPDKKASEMPTKTIAATKTPASIVRPHTQFGEVPIKTKASTKTPASTVRPSTTTSSRIQVSEVPIKTKAATETPASTARPSTTMSSRTQVSEVPIKTKAATETPASTARPSTTMSSRTQVSEVPIKTKAATETPASTARPSTTMSSRTQVSEVPIKTKAATETPASTARPSTTMSSRTQVSEVPIKTKAATETPASTARPSTTTSNRTHLTRGPHRTYGQVPVPWLDQPPSSPSFRESTIEISSGSSSDSDSDSESEIPTAKETTLQSKPAVPLLPTAATKPHSMPAPPPQVDAEPMSANASLAAPPSMLTNQTTARPIAIPKFYEVHHEGHIVTWPGEIPLLDQAKCAVQLGYTSFREISKDYDGFWELFFRKFPNAGSVFGLERTPFRCPSRGKAPTNYAGESFRTTFLKSRGPWWIEPTVKNPDPTIPVETEESHANLQILRHGIRFAQPPVRPEDEIALVISRHSRADTDYRRTHLTMDLIFDVDPAYRRFVVHHIEKGSARSLPYTSSTAPTTGDVQWRRPKLWTDGIAHDIRQLSTRGITPNVFCIGTTAMGCNTANLLTWLQEIPHTLFTFIMVDVEADTFNQGFGEYLQASPLTSRVDGRKFYSFTLTSGAWVSGLKGEVTVSGPVKKFVKHLELESDQRENLEGRRAVRYLHVL
ncbi:hypothetical protein Vi05172_g10842 [Venturia inaequalis]|nr:hypothetical protein Vi05172_g10842 [Venturia inaequalis]